MDIPKYITVAGLTLPVADIIPGHTQICVHNTNMEECSNYAKLLEENGYTRHCGREISAGSEKSYNKNLFYTYVKGCEVIFVFGMASLGVVHIVATENAPIPSVENTDTSEDAMTPTVIQCKLSKGMVYALQLADGSFVLMDGDKCCDEDTKALYDFLVSKTQFDSKPKVVMWMFTHPDSDHIVLATDFIKEYAKDVDILSFAYQFPDCDKMNFIYIDSQEIKRDIVALENNIKSYYPNSIVYTLHQGQVYNFKGAQIEILITADTIYPYSYTSANDVSAAWRVNFKNGKSLMFLGDCMQYLCRQLAYIYGDYLKSDILQVTHHGLVGGDIGLYKYIDPEICLWSTSEKRFLGILEGQKYQWCIGEGGCDFNKWIRDDSVRVRKHYHLGKTAEINCAKT